MKYLLSALVLLVLLTGCYSNHYPIPSKDTNTLVVTIDDIEFITIENVVSYYYNNSTIYITQVIDEEVISRIEIDNSARIDAYYEPVK